MPNLNVLVAFAAGILSFLSPCTLPLVPFYLGYLSGSAVSAEMPQSRGRTFAHALLFVTGFTLTFVVLFGLPATVLGNLLFDYRDWIVRIGGVALILFGLHTLRLITIPALYAERRAKLDRGMRHSWIRSVLFGVTFAAGWSPCIGPLLGSVLTLAFKQPWSATVLLFAYSAGLALPFLLTSLLLTHAIGWMRHIKRHMRTIQIISGLLMLLLGVLLVTGMFSAINAYFERITPEWLYLHL